MAKKSKGAKTGLTTDQNIQTLAEKIIGAKRVVAFTGAGISTESGIPDYRSQGGRWKKFTPVYFQDFMAHRDSRIEYWNQRMEMEKGLKTAQTNKGHRALAKLYKLKRLTALITQNIDGLHQASGIPDENLIELHGNTRRVRCMSCGELEGWEKVETRIQKGDPAPECHCGGFLKPDTISFGQAMPEAETRRATELSASADVFLVVGSTLLVQPAASMPVFARDRGAFLAIINLSETPMDNQCDILIRESAGPVLEKLSRRVEQGLAPKGL